MQFSQNFLDELTARCDIADVVGSYVNLTPKGGNQFGLCPFHNEKTPSFSVNTGKQIYYCFGCHKGGGVINFIMEVENLSFPEAVEFLAKRAGMEVPQSDRRDESAERQRKRLLQLNKEAARWYYEVLLSEEGKEITLYRLFAGEACILSASCVLDAITCDVSVEAEEDSECVVVGSCVLEELSRRIPGVKLFIMEIALSRFSDVMWVMQQILFMSMDKRLAIFLRLGIGKIQQKA